VRLSRTQLWVLGAAAGLIGVALIPLIATSEFAPDQGLWITLDLVIGWGFAGVGLFAWYRRPDNRTGALMVATAFAWYIAVAGNTDPPLLFTLGVLLNNLFVATAIHLLLAFPSGRLGSTFDRVLVGVSYVTTTLGFLPFILFADPFVDGGCASCPENLFLIESDPSFAETWLDVLSVCGITVLSLVLVRLVQRVRQASRPLRVTLAPVFLAGGALMAGLAVLLVLQQITGVSQTVEHVLFDATLVSFGLVPYVFLAGLIKGRWIRGRGLGALIRRLGEAPRPGRLREELARALGDPTLELAYWIPESEQYVDAEGHAFELPGPEGSAEIEDHLRAANRAVTEVEREGRRIAAIVHDPSLLEDEWHVRAVGAAAALALENERLEAELRAKVEELRASRARMVEIGLRERRRLERDLHDGAQQRLVSLALNLRMAQEKLASEPGAAEGLLEWSREELESALEELRELARGIHPAVLSDRGLGAAIEALAHRVPLPVEVGELPSERLPEQVELAAYFVVSEALTNITKYASASYATIGVTRGNGRLTVEVSDDGVGGADPERGSGLRGLAARLETIEGRLEVDSPPGAGTMVRARIPCD
jgi:signal transduction histidine kinase